MQKKFGDETLERIGQGLQSIYESQPAQDFRTGLGTFGGFAKDFVDTAVGRPFDYLAQQATKLGAKKFYPTPSSEGVSALGAITPENPVSFTDSMKAGGGQTVYDPVTGGETFVPERGFVPEMKRAGAQIGSVFDMMFGDARRAGERMNEGVDFKDLSPQEKLGVRFFLLDLIPLPGFSQAGKQGVKAGMDAVPTASQITKQGSVGAMSTRDAIIDRIKNEYGELTQAEIELLASNFTEIPPLQRSLISGLLTKEQQNQLLKTVKMNLEAKPPGTMGSYGIIEKDGVVGKQLKLGQRVDKFVPLEDLELKLSPPGTKKEGEFTFGILERARTRPDPETYQISMSKAKEAAEQRLALARAEEAKVIMDIYKKNKDLPIEGRKSITSLVREALPADKRIAMKGKNVGFKYIVSILDEYGLRPKGTRKAPDTDTKLELIKGTTKLTGDKSKGITDPFVRSLNAKEFPNLQRIEEFFTSQNINMKNIKRPLDEPRLFNAIESNRVALQDSLKENKFIQQILNQRGETRTLTFNKSHLDRSIRPITDADQFRGLDPTDVKILGESVNNFVQPDFELVLLRNIKNKDLKGTQEMINAMKEFFIGTKLNDPRIPASQRLSKEDYQWLDKNKLITVPTIKPGSPGAPFKNYDGVIFGTKDQPNVKELVEGELAARDYYKNRTKFEADFSDLVYTDFYAEGGLVGNMIPVKASVGKFIKGLFGETPAYRKEGMDVESLFGPTKKQKETLEKLYPGTAFPETYPGEVFYSNFDLALSRRGAPESFQNEDSFRNYMNQSGVGTDELDDAKVIPYIKSKSQAGEQIFSQDLRRIANQSPIRSVFMDAYGFRSDKINQASRDFFDPNTGSRVQIEGEAVYKDPAYPSTAIMDGALANSYRERVFRVKKDQLRGDPGSVPGGADNHKFGGSADTDGNYTLFWTRQTDRPAFIIPGEIVDKKTGEIIQPAMIADQTKLKGIEDRIQKLFADPIAKLDPQDLEGVSATVKRLVDSSAGRLTSGKAFNVVMGQIDAKQKQIKRLQNEYNAEKQRLDSFVSPQKKEIITTTIDELQSDILQSLRTKSRNIAGKLKIMADRNMSIDSMRDKELLEYFKETGGVVRPLGKTKEELIDQFNQLKEINQQLKASSQKFAFGITEGDLNYYNSVKQMQKKIMDEMTNNISKDLMQKLYPDVPLKDRVQYADAAVKQAVAEAAYRLVR